MRKIYVIMLTYNLKEETVRCLTELSQVKANGYQTRTILIDNASEDDTANEIKNSFPQVKLITNKTNRGFAAAVNQGLKLALKDPGMEFCLLLNNDTFLNKIFLNLLVRTINSDKNVGIAAPALKHYQKEKLLFGMEGHLDLKKGKVWHRNLKLIKNKKPVESDFVSGCCMLIKRQVLEKVGLLDERFYLYLDDVDYCLRAKKAFYKIVLNPKAVIAHKVSASFKNPLGKIPQSFRSHLLFIRKWVPWPYKVTASLRCLYFYPSLTLLWSLPLIKKKIFN